MEGWRRAAVGLPPWCGAWPAGADAKRAVSDGTLYCNFGRAMNKQPVSVGVIANPSSGRDVRRLLSWASVFPTAEKVNVVLRLISAMGSLGIDEAWMIPDSAGISARVREAASTAREKRGLPMPFVRLLDMRIQDDAQDSARAAAQLVARGVKLIAVLGGDGTHRAVASGCASVPLLALSTGTNNAFPEMREATTAGVAAALVATGRVPEEIGLRTNKRLRVMGRNMDEFALVDVCVSRQLATGARAVWRGEDLVDLFTSFAEPGSIGLSSIAALAHPVSREEPYGTHVRFGAGSTLLAPLLPGAMQKVCVASVQRLVPNRSVSVGSLAGTIAIDGEREFELGGNDGVRVELDLRGPRTIVVARTLEHAAQNRLLTGLNDLPVPS